MDREKEVIREFTLIGANDLKDSLNAIGDDTTAQVAGRIGLFFNSTVGYNPSAPRKDLTYAR